MILSPQRAAAPLLLGPLLCASVAGAARAHMGNLCLWSCQRSLKTVQFNDTGPAAAKLAHPCLSEMSLRSTYLCLDLNCDAAARDAGFQMLAETCRASEDGMEIPPLSIIAGYTEEDIARFRRVNWTDDYGPGDQFDEIVLPTESFFEAWFNTLDAWEYVRLYHYNYGFAMVNFWAIVILFGIAYRLYNGICYKFGWNMHPSNRSLGLARWAKRSLLLPATFGQHCSQNIWWCTIPPRIQSLTLVAFALLNLVFSVHGYKLIENNLYFPGTEHQIFRYVADRTGVISFANFPTIWLFGMRNNVAMWLTGWDFGTYNNFHRWVARIATLQAVVHSVAYTVMILRQGGWAYFVSWWSKFFWWTGELATIFMCALLACSVYWIRRKEYELFLVLHIGLSVLILATMLGHVSIFLGAYDPLFWIPVAIWVFDRILRLLRVFSFAPMKWSTASIATYDEASNIVRLRIPTREKIYKVQPGTFYYLSVMDDKRCWESHPFTVAEVSNSSASKSFSEEIPLLESEDPESFDTEQASAKTTADAHYMNFLIRPYDSFTGRLQELTTRGGQTSAALHVLVDGPYGTSQPLHKFDRVLFIVGGSGIVVPLSYLKKLSSGTQRQISTHIHWAVREPAFASEVLTNDMADTIDDDQIAVSLYGPLQGNKIMEELPAHVSQYFGRPNVHELVMAATQGLVSESLAVVACGPATMADDARRAVVDALARSRCCIEYFEEHFTW